MTAPNLMRDQLIGGIEAVFKIDSQGVFPVSSESNALFMPSFSPFLLSLDIHTTTLL
jgi:hypothetical protein